MTSAPRVAHNLLWLVLGDSVARLGIFAYTLLSARVLGPDGFGVFALAQGSALYVWIAVDLGVNLYGAREVAREGVRWRDVAGELLGLRMAAATAVAFVFAAVSWRIGPEAARPALVASAAYLLATGVSLDWAAKGLERFDVAAMANAASAVAVLVGFVLVVTRDPEPETAILVWGGAYLAGAVLLHVRLGHLHGWVRPRFEVAPWRRHLRSSLLFAASGAFLSAIQYSPVLALTMKGDFFELGQFAAAARVVTLVMSAGFLVPLAVFPTASRRAALGESLLPLSARLRLTMLGVGLAAMLVTGAGADILVETLFGPSYEDAVSYLRLLSAVLPLVFLRYAVGSLLLASGMQAWHSLASLGGLATAIVALAVLVPTWGGRGACVAWIVGELVVTMAMWVGWGMNPGSVREP